MLIPRTHRGFTVSSPRIMWYSNLSRSLVAVDAVGRDLDFANATEGEQKFYEVLRRLFRGLFDNVPNGFGDSGLEHYALGLEASKVDTHDLARLQHPQNHPTLSGFKRKRRRFLFTGLVLTFVRRRSRSAVNISWDLRPGYSSGS